jgi:hypothetical protein
MPVELAFLGAVGVLGVVCVLIYAWRTKPATKLGVRK